MRPVILYISSKGDKLEEAVKEALEGETDFHESPTGMTGLFEFQGVRPSITIVDEELEDVSGLSIASILKDIGVPNCLIYVVVHNELLENTKADRYIDASVKPEIFLQQIRVDIEKIRAEIEADEDSDGLEYAAYQQLSMLPKFITGKLFRAEYVFSAFDKLSGDSLNFWYDKEKEWLLGYLFDCEGHNVASFGQVGSTWTLLRKNMGDYQSGIFKTLSEAMSSVNRDYFNLTPIKSLVPVIAFVFDFKKEELRYCPAGIPCLFVKKYGESYSPMSLKSSIIGYEKESSFEEHILPLSEIEDVIFSSDGLSDLYSDKKDEELGIAKHDDVSAVHVHLRQKDERESEEDFSAREA